MLYKLVLILAIISFSTQAKEKVYLVGVENVNYYPLFDFSSNNKGKGSFTEDLLTAFFTHHNLSFKFIPLPIKRFDKWYIEHNIDFKFPDNFRWRNDLSNKLGIHFSEPVLKLLAGTYVTSENKALNRKDISSVATIAGFHPTLWIREISKGKVKLQEEKSSLAIVRHLLANNASATNIDKSVIESNLKLLGREGSIVLAENIYHEEFYYHFSSIRYPEIIDKFNVFMKENKPLINRLKTKYNITE